MVYTVKCFGKVSYDSTKLIPSVDSFVKLFDNVEHYTLSGNHTGLEIVYYQNNHKAGYIF